MLVHVKLFGEIIVGPSSIRLLFSSACEAVMQGNPDNTVYSTMLNPGHDVIFSHSLFEGVVRACKHIRRLLYESKSTVQFTAELALRETTIGEWLSIDQDAWGEQQPTLRSKLLASRRTHIECRNGEPILAGEPLQGLFGLFAEPAVFLREEQNAEVFMVSFRKRKETIQLLFINCH